MEEFTIYAASALWSLALGGFAWAVVDVVTAPRVVPAGQGRFEEERRQELRSASPVYRLLEPWIVEVANYLERASTKRTDAIASHLVGSGERAPWRAGEYLVAVRVQALLAAVPGCAFGALFGGMTATIFFGVFTYYAYEVYRLRTLRQKSERRRTSIRRRMASGIELMSLMMEVGASFPESLKAVAAEAKGHPLGEELDRILRDLDMGLPRRDALKSFADRMVDDDTRELMAAIIEGETLGTPLADTMSTQAEQLRLKRSQWAEKAAEESKVTLVFPAMLIMAACLVVVVAPFILSAIYTVPGG